MIEKRRFSRILYQAPATLKQGEKQLATCIQDLSLHGLLLWCEEPPKLDAHALVEVVFTLPDSEITLHLTAKIISVQERILRMAINHIDIDSIAHLRRLVEWNLGDDSLLHRNLEHLSYLEQP
ncbi:PilZ domain-containing protein [Vibrio sp. HDW18]|uniref:PilZ domain-containing protein n=1 Tax=Vibrio sp. HDW18 TaxID=2714948 RepID=UPI00140E0CC1|nr:PilZ domain-containing protein [Vibrio sp. HDW18]QIL85959.1 PilZ domain-containing protein [Vibrio sp. HDW18]